MAQIGGGRSTEQLSATVAVAGNEDLVTEILIRLPAKPLTQFKCVSKHWLSLIDDNQFSIRHARRNNKPVSALFLCGFKTERKFAFVPFDGCLLGAPHFQFLHHPGTKILDSCNGLLCYSKLDETTGNSILRYYVCNPTTRRSTRIPLMGLVYDRIARGEYFGIQHKLCNSKIEASRRPWSELNITLLGVYIVFDPLKSPHYRVVCVWEWNASVSNYEIRIAVYGSEIGLWGEPMGPFKVPYDLCFDNGVFHYGRMHWTSNDRELICFDIDGGNLKITSLPLNSRDKNVAYFGESRGHLQLVVNFKNCDDLFIVFEMERDYYSGWVLKYLCDLRQGISATPERFLNYVPHPFSLMFVDRGDNEDDTFLVLGMDGKFFSYNVKNNTSKDLCDLPPDAVCKAFMYKETLFEV